MRKAPAVGDRKLSSDGSMQQCRGAENRGMGVSNGRAEKIWKQEMFVRIVVVATLRTERAIAKNAHISRSSEG